MSLSSHWRAGFEIEVVLGDLDDPRFFECNDDPMDMASSIYCQAVAKRLTVLTTRKWSAPITRKTKPGFYVVPEYDLDPLHYPSGIVGGVELITPPLPLREADDLRQLLREAIEDMGGWYNFEQDHITDGFGWHINVDAGPDHRLDIERFALGADELSILVENRRYPNQHAAPQRHAYGVPLLRNLLSQPSGALAYQNFENFLIHHGGSGKQYAANFEKLNQDYVELRHYGIGSFLGETPLSDLVAPLLAAFQMDNETETKLSNFEVQRFQILKEWLTEIQPRLSHSAGDKSGFVMMTFGEVRFDDVPVGRWKWDGSLGVSLLGKGDTSEVAAILDQQYPDIYEALAVLALDIAEIRNRKLTSIELENGAFQQAIINLEKLLMNADLMEQIELESGSWWSTV